MDAVYGHLTTGLILTTSTVLLIALAGGVVARTQTPAGNLLSAAAVITSLTLGVFSILRRAVPVQSDVYIYQRRMQMAEYEGLADSLRNSEKDFAFTLILAAGGAMHLEFRTVWAAIATAIALSIFTATFLLVRRLSVAATVLCAMPIYFPFLNFTTNTLRQGLAGACLLLAFALRHRGHRRALWWLVLCCALLTHWSSVLPIVALAMFWLTKSGRTVAMLAWAITAALFLSGINAVVFGRLVQASDLSRGYLDAQTYTNAGAAGARLDFFIFTSILVVTVLVAARRTTLSSPLVNEFVILASTFNALGFVAFSDRIAAYTWIAWPVVLAVVLSSNERRSVPKAADRQVSGLVIHA